MAQTPAPASAAIYARISRADSDDMLAVDRQVAACRRYALEHSIKVLGKPYIDHSVSASSGTARPQFERLLADRPPAVIVWHLDRLVRLTRDLERVLDVLPAVYSVAGGITDLATPAGRSVARTIVAWATYEGEQKAARMMVANVQAAEAGKPWASARAPFGYEKVGTKKDTRWVPVEPAATLVRGAYADFIDGKALSTICAEWTEAGVVSATGGRWRQNTLSHMLRHPRYAGIRTLRGEVVAQKAQWPGLVPEATWTAAQRLLDDPARSTGGSKKAANLLTGLGRCGACGATVRKGQRSVSERTATHPGAFYRCNVHHHLSRLLPAVDEVVAGVLVERLGQPDALRRPEPDTDDERARNDLLARRRYLAEDYAAGRISREDYNAGLDANEAPLARVEAALVRADCNALTPLTATTPEGARARWDAAPLALHRKAVALLIDVWVLPARAEAAAVPPDAIVMHDPDTDRPLVAIRWRA